MDVALYDSFASSLGKDDRLENLLQDPTIAAVAVYSFTSDPAAVRDSLDAVEYARRHNGARDNRHHLAHIQVVDAADVERFAALEVTANAQPLWACRDQAVEELTLPFLVESARGQQYVFGSLHRAGW